MQENDVEDHGPRWLSCFPDSCTSLISLNFACIKGEVNPGALERLVARSPNLRSLRLNRSVSVDTLSKILARTPNLEDLGTGNLTDESESYLRLSSALEKCKMLRSLSGFWDASPICVPFIYPLCHHLTGLNLSYTPTLDYSDLTKMISRCVKLQRLWVSPLLFLVIPFFVCHKINQVMILSLHRYWIVSRIRVCKWWPPAAKIYKNSGFSHQIIMLLVILL